LKTTSRAFVATVIVGALLTQAGNAVAAANGKTVDGVYLKATVRTPVQIAAFYEARGFPGNALAVLENYCFVTVVVRNRSNRVVWLEPARWSIQAGEGREISLRTLEEWSREWKSIGLPAAQQSAFQWTQLPQARDLQPNEPVGGNIAFPRFSGDFSLKMEFATGPGRDGSPIQAVFTGMDCGARRNLPK